MKLEEIDVGACNPFRDYPFKVKDDADMDMLVQSILDNGVMFPILVRPQSEIGYEIVSGHRRVFACKKAGIEKIPALIRQMDRDEAVICMVDSNLQRESLLPSEKAFAYKMKVEALSHQGKASVQVGQKSSRGVVAEDAGESETQVQRYIRLTYLIRPLLDLVDEGRIALGPAVELSYLPEEAQRAVYDYYTENEVTPSYSQANQMKKRSAEGTLTPETMLQILDQPKANQVEMFRIPIERIRPFFSPRVPKEKMLDVIVKALEYYAKAQERKRNSRDAR